MNQENKKMTGDTQWSSSEASRRNLFKMTKLIGHLVYLTILRGDLLNQGRFGGRIRKNI